MRLNQFIAAASGLSRRAADAAIQNGQVTINGRLANVGHIVNNADHIQLDGALQKLPTHSTTILLNKPTGYVCSRNGQGNQTIYKLLPVEYHGLKPIGRLDKDSSGLLLLTDDGHLANTLTHPRYAKEKIYIVTLDKPLTAADKVKIEQGVKVDNYISRLQLSEIHGSSWRVTISQGRNRQIRRTFAEQGYTVEKLQRTVFGPYHLTNLKPGEWRISLNKH